MAEFDPLPKYWWLQLMLIGAAIAVVAYGLFRAAVWFVYAMPAEWLSSFGV